MDKLTPNALAECGPQFALHGSSNAPCGCGAGSGYGCPKCGQCFCNGPCGCGR